jgi:serine/threonine protein kinase
MVQSLMLKNLFMVNKSTIKALNNYSAPELLTKCTFGLAIDIWSLGCLLNYILYETL